MLLGFEGFDWPVLAANTTNDYGFGSMLQSGQAVWQSGPGSGNSKVAGQIAGSAWSSGLGFIGFFPGATYPTLIMGARIRPTAIGLMNVFDIRDPASQCGVAINASGRLIFWRGNNSTPVGSAGPSVLVANNWYYVEVKVTFSNTGSFDIRLDGISETSGSGVDTTNTANNFATGVYLFPNHGGQTAFIAFDDFYLADNSGSGVTDFIGPVRVETLRPASNDSVQFTPLSSTNASNVDDVDNDSDTTYNSDTVAGHIDMFNMTDLSSSPANIYGVDVLATMRKTDVAARTGRTKLLSGVVTSNGFTTNLQSSYAKMRELYLLDPNTAGAFNVSSVNALKAGYELVA